MKRLKTLEEAIRQAAKAYVENVPIEELLRVLPCDILKFQHLAPAAKGLRIKPSRRVLKRVSHRLTAEEGALIRKELGHFAVDSAEYRKKRDELCRKLRIAPRQIAGAFSKRISARRKSAEST